MTGIISTVRPSLIVGGRVFTDLNNLVILEWNVISLQYYTMFNGATNSQHQVNASKTLNLYAIKVVGVDTSSRYGILYGDTAVNASSSAPTNPVRYTNYGGYGNFNINSGGNGSYDEYAIHFTVPSSKYPAAYSVNSNSGVSGLVYGEEK